MSDLYESKYFACTEPLERADRKEYDFDHWEISDFLKELDREYEEYIREAKAEAWQEGYEDKANEQSETLIERGLCDPVTNPYKEQTND